jgi:hemolysin III
MMSDVSAPRYRVGEEIANSITHGIGIVLAIAALALMTSFASLYGDAWHVVGCSVFGTTLIVLYTASTLYHSIPTASAKQILRAFDHSAIFVLIAGTYTPFTLVNLRGPWGWTLFGLVWGCAIVGIAFRLVAGSRWRIVTIALYVLMGWVVVVAVKPLLSAVAPGGLLLLAGGGIAYTGGIVFYAWRSMPYHHAVWHLFVLTGSVLHFFAVLLYVIPLA